MFSIRSACVVAVSVAVLLATAGTALAQPGGGRGGRGMFGGGGENMLPAINSRQVDHYAKILNLSKDQKDAAGALLEGYAQQAAVAAKAMRDAGDKAREEFRDSQDPAVFDKMQKSMTKFRDERKKLDESFMNDLKSVLTTEQADKWPAVERAQRRDSTIRWGRLSGEGVDLTELADQQKLSDESMKAVVPLLQQYEEELDRELVRRNEVYQSAMEKMMELRRNGDMEAMQAMIEKGREAGKRVRDLNRQYARQIADLLPAEKRDAFDLAFKKASYPEVFRSAYATRAADAAAGMKDLSAEQKEQIETLNKRFKDAMEAMQPKYITAVQESEDKFNLATMAANGWRQQGAVSELRDERRSLEKKLLDDVKKVLSEEQATRLPEKTEDEQNADRWGNGRGGPGGGGGGQGGGGRRQQGGNNGRN